ncbi:hypothetical protein P3342_012545 [Pyrenophora teres f. teres]|nr:hypothetical protein P3342_012545 [Pyrenophora teres f. teres]
MVKGLYETARWQLFKDVLLLDLDERDCLNWRRAGASKHPDNHLDGWQDWLLDRVLEGPAQEIHPWDGQHTTARADTMARRRCSQYMKGVRRFKESLFTLVHLSAGAPARGTEITSIQCENSADGVGYRGFSGGGLVSFTTTYHKGYSFSKRVKTIHRYVPQEVSELVVYSRAPIHRRSPDAAQRRCPPAFLWGQSQRSSGRTIATAKSTTETNTAKPIVKRHNQLIRRILGYRSHTPRLARADLQYMSAALGTRAWRHAYPAIHRELAKDGQARDWLKCCTGTKRRRRAMRGRCSPVTAFKQRKATTAAP